MAKMIKHGLGRGLDALMGDMEETVLAPAAAAVAGDQVTELLLADIDPNREQPRRRFDEQALHELAESIKSVGVIQPVIVRKVGARYQLIAGERRWRASFLAEKTTIPAIVRDWDAAKRLEVTLIENLQRDDLNPVEEALGVRTLMDQCGYTQEEASERLGRSRPAIANLLRLLNLPESILEMLREGKLSAGHARALAGLSDRDRQVRLANLAASQGWSVRQLEKICKEPAKAEKPEKLPVDPECRQLEKMAREVFGTKAQLDGDQQKGRLVISYFSGEDLQRIWDILECVRQNGG